MLVMSRDHKFRGTTVIFRTTGHTITVSGTETVNT